MSSTLKVDILQDSGGNNLVTSNGSGVITAAGFGKVGQVVSTTKTNTFSETVGNGVKTGNITGLTLNITPSSTSSKIFLISHINVGLSNTNGIYTYPYRDNALITGAVGDASGSRSRGFGSQTADNTDITETIGFSFLDSPNTNSQVTYSFRLSHSSGSDRTIYVNTSHVDSNAPSIIRSASTITAMEILP